MNSTDDEDVIITNGFIIFEIVIRLLLALTGTMGNTFVIYAVVMTPKLRTVPNAFVTTVALLDLVACGILVPLMVFSTVDNEWPFGVKLCRAHGFTLILFHALSLNILGLIALNRFLNITKPLHVYRKFATPHLFVLQIAGAIIVAGVPVLSPLFGIGDVNFVGFNPILGHCTFGFDVEGVWTYQVVLLSLGLIIGIVVIPFNYIMIYKHVGASRSRVHAWQGSTFPKPPGSRFSEQRAHSDVCSRSQEGSLPVFHFAIPSRRNLHRDNIRLTRNLWLLFFTYMLSIIPFFLFVFFDRDYELPAWLWRTVDILLWSTSTANPYLYAWMTSSFREAFRKLIYNCSSP
ncbi:G-protein coupled receptor 84-like [Diadema setosum]|uniref:G-protein coupled receptor 84-like n=1 Tax=Diadema setosum TaxID=31175 RepID=UPI003B3B360E